MINLPQKTICEHLWSILEHASWESLVEPTIFLGLTLWDPDKQSLPLITILPRIEKAKGNRYGKIECDFPIEITALIPMAYGDDAMIGVIVAEEIARHIFGARKEDWESFPDSMIDIIYVDGGIINYPDELNPQMLTAGITINVLYEKHPFPFTEEIMTGRLQTTAKIKIEEG